MHRTTHPPASPLRASVTVLLPLTAALGLAFAAFVPGPRPGAQPALLTRSPIALAYSPDGRRLAVADRSAGEVVALATGSDGTLWRSPASGPAAIAWSPDGARVYVAEMDANAVAVLDGRTGRRLGALPAGAGPTAVAVAADGARLAVAAQFSREVRVLDARTGATLRRFPAAGGPHGLTVTRRGVVVSTDLLPAGRGTDADQAAAVRVFDLGSSRTPTAVRLPAGSTAARCVAASPDGAWAYVTHSLCRFHLPTTHLDRGWVNTNAVSIIDLSRRRYHATVLLDHLYDGAADPWGVTVSPDGRALWVALSGVHEIARIDLAGLHRGLRGEPMPGPGATPSAEYAASATSAWAEIKRDRARRTALAGDLTALPSAGLLRRTPVPGQGPRGIAVTPDGRRVAVALYFDGRVALMDGATGRPVAVRSVGLRRPADAGREGERIFHDATLTYQRWLSCATCHPDGRVDGLNWDNLNDGLGNPKNTRSLLQAHRRAPVMSQGVRADAHVATVAGFRFLAHHEPTPLEVAAVKAYYAAMRPQPSPYLLPGGRLSARAERGRALFESKRTECGRCHGGPYHTDQKLYDVGTRGELDTVSRFVTPVLTEAWRTRPYLHDGSALTMREVLTTRNRGDRHGRTSHLSPTDIDALAEYLLSL